MEVFAIAKRESGLPGLPAQRKHRREMLGGLNE
jgi:hypothetical protein